MYWKFSKCETHLLWESGSKIETPVCTNNIAIKRFLILGDASTLGDSKFERCTSDIGLLKDF
jgi:hypothetical protein